MALTREKLALLARHPNVAAFLRMIRLGEGTRGEDGYRTLYGGGKFDSFAAHPNRKITAGAYTSTAAGAYQFLIRTWRGLVEQYGFPDFSPQCQDEGAVALIAGRGAMSDVIAGRFEQAVAKCAKEWASLPGSPYGQPTVTMDQARAEYERWGGRYEPVEVAAPAPAPAPEPTIVAAMERQDQPAAPYVTEAGPVPAEPAPEPASAPIDTRPYVTEAGPAIEAPAPAPRPARPRPTMQPSLEGDYGAPIMAPFLAAAMPAIVQAVPQLIRMFGSDGHVTERNAKAAEAVAAIVQDATGARNIQEAAERVQANPEAARAAQEAVLTQWFTLTEVGGGIEAAREADAKFVEGDRPIWKSPAFVMTGLLLPLIYLVVGVVLLGPVLSSRLSFSSDMKSLIIGTIIGGLLGSVSSYWLGSSSSSSKKDDMLAQSRGLK